MPPDYPVVPDILFDPGPIAAVQHFFGPGWVVVAETLTHVGSGVGILLLFALSFWLSGRRLAYGVVVAAVFGLSVSLVLWLILGVPRPDAPSIEVRDQVPVSSFPSGHTITTIMIWGFLATRGYIAWPLVAAAVVVSMVTRLYLGVHYLGDVLGGVVIGALLLAIFVRVWPPVADWLAGRSYRFYLVLGALAVVGALGFIPFAAANPHPEIWGAIGWAIGGTIAILVEYRAIHFVPAALPHEQQALKLAIGLAGFIPVGLVLWLLGGATGAAGYAVGAALAAVWAALLAPWIFATRGWSRPADHQPHELTRRERDDHQLAA